jgi:hypothetical protein
MGPQPIFFGGGRGEGRGDSDSVSEITVIGGLRLRLPVGGDAMLAGAAGEGCEGHQRGLWFRVSVDGLTPGPADHREAGDKDKRDIQARSDLDAVDGGAKPTNRQMKTIKEVRMVWETGQIRDLAAIEEFPCMNARGNCAGMARQVCRGCRLKIEFRAPGTFSASLITVQFRISDLSNLPKDLPKDLPKTAISPPPLMQMLKKKEGAGEDIKGFNLVPLYWPNSRISVGRKVKCWQAVYDQFFKLRSRPTVKEAICD